LVEEKPPCRTHFEHSRHLSLTFETLFALLQQRNKQIESNIRPSSSFSCTFFVVSRAFAGFKRLSVDRRQASRRDFETIALLKHAVAQPSLGALSPGNFFVTSPQTAT
jgi:hypothetical protein